MNTVVGNGQPCSSFSRSKVTDAALAAFRRQHRTEHYEQHDDCRTDDPGQGIRDDAHRQPVRHLRRGREFTPVLQEPLIDEHGVDNVSLYGDSSGGSYAVLVVQEMLRQGKSVPPPSETPVQTVDTEQLPEGMAAQVDEHVEHRQQQGKS